MDEVITDNNMNAGGGETVAEDEDHQQQQCPVFSTSEHFRFITDEAYAKEEARWCHNGDDEEVEDHGNETITAGLTSNAATSKMFEHVRPMRAGVGVLWNPHGSTRLWQGNTCVLAAVYGPSDVRMSKELPHRAAVDVLFRPKVTGTGNLSAMIAAGMMDPVMEERAIEQTVAGVLEAVIHVEDHVQAGFNVILHEIENDGGLLSACLNASCLALLNAGCSMRCLFAAVTVCVAGERVVVDPCVRQVNEMKKECTASGRPFSISTFVVTNHGTGAGGATTPLPQVLHVSTVGRVTGEALAACYRMVAATGSLVTAEVFAFLKGVIAADLVVGLGGGGGEEQRGRQEEKEGEDHQQRVKKMEVEQDLEVSEDDGGRSSVEEEEEEEGEIINISSDDDSSSSGIEEV